MSSAVSATAIPVPDMRRAYAALALGILCIGFSGIFTKWSGVDGPVSGFYRVAIATLVLAIPFGLRAVKNGRPARGGLLLAVVGGLFFAGDLGVWNTSLEYTTAANATLLGNFSTFWVGLIALFFFRERLGRVFWLGMGLAIAGASIIFGRDVIEHPQLGWGDLLAVGSSLFYAGYLLNTQFARRRLDTASYMWLSSAAAAVLLLAYCLIAGMPLFGFSLESYMALLALGLISHVAGWMAINYALGHLPASLTSVSLLAQPLVTAIVAVPLLGEAISWFQVVGGACVLLGIYLANTARTVRARRAGG
jgi:drug/metabolite transporter (DMT)-like permease